MASGERRPISLAFSSGESIHPFPLWKRFLWLGILCLLILTCLVGVLVLAFSHFESTDAQTTQIRTGALIGFGFLLAAVLAWTVFVYVKLGRLCTSRPRNERREEFMALAAPATIPAARSGRLPPAMNNPSTAVSTRLETSIERNLVPTDNSTVNNNNGSISLVSQEGVRVTSGRFILSHELVPISRVQIEGPQTLIDNRRTVRRFIECPGAQLPPPYGPLSVQQEYIHRGYDIARNSATMASPAQGPLQWGVQTTCREMSRIQSEALRTQIDHGRLSSQYLDRTLHPPPPYRYQDIASPPPAYDAISICRRNTTYSESSNPPSYRSAPSSPVLSRHSDTERSLCMTTSRSPLLYSEEGNPHNEGCNTSFLSSSQLSLSQDGDVFVCETAVQSLHSPLSPLAQNVQSESCVLTLHRAQSLGVLSLTEAHGEASSSRVLRRSQIPLSADGEFIQQQNDRETFHNDGSSITFPTLVSEGVVNGPVIYVYLGQAEQTR